MARQNSLGSALSERNVALGKADDVQRQDKRIGSGRKSTSMFGKKGSLLKEGLYSISHRNDEYESHYDSFENEAPTDEFLDEWGEVEEDADTKLYLEELKRAREERGKSARAKTRKKIITIALIIGCVYLVFLIYGAINTQYIYNSEGNVVTEKLSVTQLKNIKEFEKIAVQYRQARSIYEEVLLLDYRIGSGIEDPLTIGPEYEKVLEKIEKLTLQLGGVSVESQYNQLLTSLTTWVGTDIAVYCQNMSAAISQNNAANADQAIQYKEQSYNDFMIITQNIATLGAGVDGVDISDIIEWSPELYIQNQTGEIYQDNK